MPVLESDQERASNRLQSAARIFYIMAVVKVLELLGSLRPPTPGSAGVPETRQLVLTLLFVYFAVSIALCVLIGRKLEDRAIWARNLGLAYSAFHIAHIALFYFFGTFGLMAIISGVLGIIAFFSLLVASGLGAFKDI